mmetsp:Transcript_118683/g.215853  ORF Transcript_118683/g.215853 Transcript_118683/m.215853 type:complete len:488 (-) Transcript_118683:97-1560(-)
MPNRLSVAKKERRAEEKVRQAEEKFKELAEGKRRKIEKKAQRLAERKAAVAPEPDSVVEVVEPATKGIQEVVVQQAAEHVKGKIDVLVQCLTGEEFWLTPSAQDPVTELKNMLAEVWGIPALCQQLLTVCSMLHDTELLCHYVKDGSMPCTAVIVVHEACPPATLAKLALRGTEGVMNAVFRIMEDDGARYQFFTELRKISKQGDERVVAVLIEIMKKVSDKLSSAFLQAEVLYTLARVGAHSECAQTEVIARLQEASASVRIAALEALCHFAIDTSLGSIRAVAKCLEDDHEDVRFQAVQVLTDIATKGNAQAVVCEVKTRLEHVSGGVRRAAVQAYSHISALGDAESSSTEDIFVRSLADPDPDVRAAAVQAIDCVAPCGQHTFNALLSVLFDPDGIVRQLTLRALRRFAYKNDGLLIGKTKPFLRHKDPIIRCTAVEALDAVTDFSVDNGVISELHCLLSDGDALVRSTVARVLCDFPEWRTPA